MNLACTNVIAPPPKGAIFDINTVYCERQGDRLIRQYCELPKSDTFGTYYRQFSTDGGISWSQPVPIYQPVRTEEGVWRWTESALYYDTEEDAILFLYNYSLYGNNGYSHARDATLRLFYQVSHDGGKGFGDPIQVVVKGRDSVNWAPGVHYGQNCAMVSFCAPKKIEGKILVPVATAPPVSGTQHSSLLSAGCLIGEWHAGRIEWELGETVALPAELSARGLCEPTIARLLNGQLLMIMRGSNGGGYGLVSDCPSYKWYAVSEDCGHTWKSFEALQCSSKGNVSDPPQNVRPWTYHDGEPFFSPASGSCLIRHSKTDVLYWIGNITPENPQGNLPRRPLILAEIDEETGCPLKKTVRSLLDAGAKYPETTQFSNFRMYEDRKTGEFVLSLPHIGMHGTGHETALKSGGLVYRFHPGGFK